MEVTGELLDIIDSIAKYRPESITGAEYSYLIGWIRGYFDTHQILEKAFREGMDDGLFTSTTKED